MRTLVIGFMLLVSSAIEAQSPVTAIYKRGELVKVRDVKEPAVLKIVGLPDEIVQVDESGVYVNDAPVTGFSKEFLARNKWPRQIIPFGHYFVIGEERVGQDPRDHLGVYPEESIERAP
jgi:hypothetical protein